MHRPIEGRHGTEHDSRRTQRKKLLGGGQGRGGPDNVEHVLSDCRKVRHPGALALLRNGPLWLNLAELGTDGGGTQTKDNDARDRSEKALTTRTRRA